MITNISNHPSKGWPKEQYLYASSRWGEIVDVPFPVIRSEASEEEVMSIAADYIKRLPAKEEGPVFIAGEYFFTYAMADMLLRLGYQVLYVNSENKITVTPREDGSTVRKMEYHFVSFKDYERLSENFDRVNDFEPIFINCSCHYPSSGWDKEAYEHALRYGKIMDLPLKPFAGTKEEIARQAYDHLKQIDSIRPSAVLVDGEFGTFFMITDALLKKGYRVVVKCSERRSKDVIGEDGTLTKISEFRFVKYRQIKAMEFE